MVDDRTYRDPPAEGDELSMTMLRNFDTDLDRKGVLSQTIEVETKPRVTRRAESTQYKDQQEWDWRALRDYVVHQIEEIHEPFPRDEIKESGIFKGFIKRWGSTQAEAIARYAFEIRDGYWKGAPISVNRFCKNSDPYFAEPIAAKLEDAAK